MNLFKKASSVYLFLLLFIFTVSAQNIISVCSWNIKDFGKSKNDTTINFIADIVKEYDILAIQEVVAGYGGAQAVARLHDVLNRKGSKWDYIISDPTSGSPYSSERYAYLWKTNKVKKIDDAWLDKKFADVIDREPYFINFTSGVHKFTLVTFHAVSKKKQPETEIKYFKYYPVEHSDKNLIFCGDFNLSQTHTVFNPLKSVGYLPLFTGQKTSLRKKCINNDCLASEYDNIFYHSGKIKFIKSGVIHFYKSFSDLKEAENISDHIPIFFQFILN